MAKKAKAPVQTPVVRVIQKIDPEKELKLAEDAWSKALDQSNRNYDKDMDVAWRKYAAAIPVFLEPDKKAKTAGQDFDKQYDKDMTAALTKYHTQMEIADTVIEDAKEKYLKAKK